MLVTDKTQSEARPPVDSASPGDISIGTLLAGLAAHKEKALVFTYGGRTIRPGYHVTEVKAGHFAALDCGANAESWSEIFIQLLDGHEERLHMPAGKFSAIIRKVTEHVALDLTAKLTFEVSDGVRPMELYCASLPTLSGNDVIVELAPRPASCKPRDRWLEEQKTANACCAASSGAKVCC